MAMELRKRLSSSRPLPLGGGKKREPWKRGWCVFRLARVCYEVQDMPHLLGKTNGQIDLLATRHKCLCLLLHVRNGLKYILQNFLAM